MSLSSGLSSYRPSSYASGDSRYSTGSSYSYYNDPTSPAWRQSSSYSVSSSNRPLRVSTSETTSLSRQSSTDYPYGRSYTANYATTYGDSYGSYRDRTASRSHSQDRGTILNSLSGGSLRLSTQTRSPAGTHVRWAMDRISSGAPDRRTASPIRTGRSSYLDDLHSYYRRPADSLSSTASSIDDLDDRWALRPSATVGSVPESALKSATLSRSYATNSLSSFSAANRESRDNETESSRPSPRPPLGGKSRVVWADDIKEDAEPMTASTSRALAGSGDTEKEKRLLTSSLTRHERQASSSTGGNNDEDQHGLVGLENLGNTCFMNSVLQCLSNTKELQAYCLNGAVTSDVNNNQTSKMKGALMKGFCELLSELWDRQHGRTAVNPGRFRDQVKKFAPRFGSYSQQDSQEFLRYLLQGLHEDINQVPKGPKMAFKEIDEQLPDAEKSAEAWRRYLRTEKSKIVDIFVGQFKSELRCTVCDHVSTTFDPFWDLSLSIPAKTRSASLYSCFDLFVQEEVLDGDEMPTCEKCKKRRKCTKRFSIQRFPQVLVLHLKRFSGDHFRARLSTLVEFPLEGLDLRPYAAKNTDVAPIYDLYAVSNHSGTPSFGHYTAYCKHVTSGQWFYYDDRNVRPVSATAVVSELAYVLFYELSPSSLTAAKL